MEKVISQETEHDTTTEALAAQTASIQTSVRAESRGIVNVPSLIGNNFSAPVIINFNTSTGGSENEPSRACDKERKQILHDKLKLCTKHQYEMIYEGTSDEGGSMALADIYTELFIVEGHTGGVSHEHEVRQIEAVSRTIGDDTPVQFSDIFKVCLELQNQRTVLTLGIAGVGKTVTVQKFALEWAEGKTNQDLDYVFLMPFRDLNAIVGEQHSLYTLLCYFYQKLDLKIEDVQNLDSCNIIFVFDGLDESCLTLNFRTNKMVCDVTALSSVDLLIVNLIIGNMLPSARIWITSRPAAVHQISRKHINIITEVRGFNDDQKEEYFIKRIRNQEKAHRIISHIKKSKSLHIMCHIPVFCWISATVLQEVFNDLENACQEGTEVTVEDIPTTLSGMYTNFILYQIDLKFHKYPRIYQGSPQTCVDYSEEIIKLAELAYRNLIKEKIIFFEKDLQECGIDVQTASVYSGMFTEIFKREKTLFKFKAYSFVHLSIQEFLAALYVFYIYSTTGRSLLHQTTTDKLKWQVKNTLLDLHKSAIRNSLQSKSGHLDIFLRFLLGISMESSQYLLRKVFPQLSSVGGGEKTVQFIKEKLRERILPERSINLLHCLSEMKDNSLLEEIKSYVTSRSDHQLAPADCSAIVYLLLMSNEDLDEFDLKKYLKSNEGLRRMIPLVVASRRAMLNKCNLTKQSCELLAGALSSRMSCLTELDLSNNDLYDAGVSLLTKGLQSPHCKLEILKLNKCNLTKQSCELLAGALSSRMSCLTELDLSNNDLYDAGVSLLTKGLQSPHCKLEILKLCGCLITEKGFSFLASALSLDTSMVKKLDLRHNNPGNSGVKMISDIIENPSYKLEKFKADLIGEIQKRMSLLSYMCELTMDPNTAHRSLCLYNRGRTLCWSNEEISYPEHPERFQTWKQVLCREALSHCHYWEAEWRGSVFGVIIGITYKSISRVGEANVCLAGHNDKSWSLHCSNYSYTALHNGTTIDIKRTPDDIFSFERIAVYLDLPAGILSFYRVCGNTLTLIHRFRATFTEPVYPVFRLVHHSATVIL